LRDLTAHDRLAARAGESGRDRSVVLRLIGPLAVLAGAFVVMAVGWRFGPALGAATAVVLGVATVLVRDASAARVAADRRSQVRGAVRVLVAELEAGAVPGAALRAAADVAPRYFATFGAAAGVAAAGGDAAQALRGDPDTRALGLAWALGQDTGAPLAKVLGRVAGDLAAVDDQSRTVQIALSGPRSSAVMLAGLPVVGLALGASMGARPLAFLGGAGAGQLVCLLGVLLDAAGVLWMRRILRGAQRA
jgi:tight adherence protein B